MKKVILILCCLSLFLLCSCAEKKNNESIKKEDVTSTVSKENKPIKDITELDGNYQDSTSMRATAKVEVSGKNSAIITVSWGNSAFETVQWTMTASLSSDGTLGYSNEKQSIISTDESGKQTEKVVYSDKSGYFKVENGDLLWLGAYDEKCRECKFKKITEE